MTREETKRLLRIISSTYSNFKPTSIEDTLAVWSKLLENDSYKEIEATLYAYIRNDTTGFAPTPGQLVSLKATISADDGLTDAEAWGLVRKALADSTYHASKRYAELPESIKRSITVETLQSWATDEDYSEGVAQGLFLKNYHNAKERSTKDYAIPSQLKGLISGVADRLAIGEMNGLYGSHNTKVIK